VTGQFMRMRAEVSPPGEVDPALLHKNFYIDHICLFAAAAIALINFLPGVFTPIQRLLPATWLDMRMSCAVMTLYAATSLFLSEGTQAKHSQWVGNAFAALTCLVALASLMARLPILPPVMARFLDQNQISLREGSLQFSAITFLLMGIVMLLPSSTTPKLDYIASGFVGLLSVVALSLLLEYLFGLAGMPGESHEKMASTPVTFCIALLAFVVVLRRTERGVLSILWGYGTGSRIARKLAPVVLALPVLRELLRANLLRAGLIPSVYAGAILASIGTILALILLLILARSMNQMQERVQGQTLRDELTGLNSVKGFYLLAEQAFRYSRRIQEPFGVLFVDMDNLKTVNDQLGHSTGSVSLVETAKLLNANFREMDVIGRVGGDEFIVAGQFNENEAKAAIERLNQAVSRKNEVAGHMFPISLSMGYAVTEDFSHDTLRGLVAKADEAMYRQKRAKKAENSEEITEAHVPA
jgi:diguanylate cyclase (GGDEF)-like protein